MSRQKKYKMKAISSAFSEKGGYSAQFVSDGYTIDARKEILPGIIKANGVQVGEGVAWDLIQAFLKECAARAAATGETVTVGSLITFGLAIRGWFANKDSKAAKENVRVTATLLNDLRPTVVFSMSNDIDGATLTLFTVMSDGCQLGHVKQAAAFRINGKHLVMLAGDKVSASAKNAAGETVDAECEIIESADDHVDATLPAAFNADEFVGREIAFKVEGRCGDVDAGTQTKTITAVIDKGEPHAGEPEITRVFCEGHEGDADKLFDNAKVTIEGSGLAAANGIKFVFQDKMSGEHELEVGEYIEIAKSDTKLVINDTMIVETMRTICTDSETELNTGSGAAIKVTLTDGTELYHAVAFG